MATWSQKDLARGSTTRLPCPLDWNSNSFHILGLSNEISFVSKFPVFPDGSKPQVPSKAVCPCMSGEALFSYYICKFVSRDKIFHSIESQPTFFKLSGIYKYDCCSVCS